MAFVVALIHFGSVAGAHTSISKTRVSCVEELTARYGADMPRTLRGRGLSLEDLAAITNSPYEEEAAEFSEIFQWLSTNPGDSNHFFRALSQELKTSLNEERDGLRYSRREIVQRVIQRSRSLPKGIAALAEEWLEASSYPRVGAPPTRNEVIMRIRRFTLHTPKRLRLEFYKAMLEIGIIRINHEVPRKGFDELLLRECDKRRFLERFFQNIVFHIDRTALGVLPFDSYPPPTTRREKFAQFIPTILFGNRDRSKGNFYPRSFIAHVVKTALRFQDGRLGPIQAHGDSARHMLVRLVTTALQGNTFSAPRPSQSRDSFRRYLMAQLDVIANQARQEKEKPQFESEAEPEPDELVFQLPPDLDLSEGAIAADLVDSEIASGAIAEPIALPEAEAVPFIAPAAVANPSTIRIDGPEEEDPLGKALIREQRALNRSVPDRIARRRERKAKVREEQEERARRFDLDFGEFNGPLSSLALELTRLEGEALFDRMAFSQWHARMLRRQLKELENHLTAAEFDRVFQSFCWVLQELERSDRYHPESELGRHIKPLKVPALSSAKPRGGSTVRLILGRGPGGFYALSILPDSHNQDRVTNQQLFTLSDQFLGRVKEAHRARRSGRPEYQPN